MVAVNPQAGSDEATLYDTATVTAGNAVTDIGVTERCERSDETEVGVLTSFVVPIATIDGGSVLSHTREAGGEEATGQITITGTGSISFRDLT